MKADCREEATVSVTQVASVLDLEQNYHQVLSEVWGRSICCS